MTTEKALQPAEEKIELTLPALDPKKFFQDRKGLFVSSYFEENIRDKAEPSEAGQITLTSFDLTKPASDAEIEAELPEKHMFTESEVCAVVAALIEKQSKGEEGALKTGWDWNLFYTPSVVVRVIWYDSSWGMFCYERVSVTWYSYDRVFSPATSAA